MRALVRPQPPEKPGFDAQAAALVNAWGRFCSFCEKPLTFRLELFHRGRGPLEPDAVRPEDWPDLFLACGDCIDASAGQPVDGPYLWPDDPRMKDVPFVYRLRLEVPRRVVDAEGDTVLEDTVDLVLVEPAPGLDPSLARDAAATLELFRLNGRHFVADGPRVEVPYADYLSGEDQRPEQRLDVFRSGVDAGRALASAYPLVEVRPDYARGIVSLIGTAVTTRGYVSTWETAVTGIVRLAGDEVYGALLAAIQTPAETGESPKPSPPEPRDTLSDRKRRRDEMTNPLENDEALSDPKRRRMNSMLDRLLPEIDVGEG